MSFTCPIGGKRIRTTYNLQDTPLEASTIQKYLGVDLSTHLDWINQINPINTKANRNSWLTSP